MSGKTICIEYLYTHYDWTILSRIGIKHNEDLKQDIVLILYQQSIEILNQIIDRNQFQFYITRIVLNQRNYKGSNYHKNYSGEKFVYEMPELEQEELDKEYVDRVNANEEQKTKAYNNIIKKYKNYSKLSDPELLKSFFHFYLIRKTKKIMTLKDMVTLTGFSKPTIRKYFNFVKEEILEEYNKNRII